MRTGITSVPHWINSETDTDYPINLIWNELNFG